MLFLGWSLLGIADIVPSRCLFVIVIWPNLVLKGNILSPRECIGFVYDCISGLYEGISLVYGPGLVSGSQCVCLSLVMFVPYYGNNCLFVSVLFGISTVWMNFQNYFE